MPSPTRSSVLNPNDFCAFCFRGEGRANFVISAKNIQTGLRIVWRFAKARKSGLVTVKARSEQVGEYMARIVAPFFDENFLLDSHIVMFDIEHVHQLAKIPSLPPNRKIPSFSDLYQLPAQTSFLPLTSIPRGAKRLSALQMIDATRIPNATHLDSMVTTSTITVEVKPKQGFYQHHPNVDVSNCNNCILQIEKCGSAHYSEMYEFCPLDLFSASFVRMRKALHSLFLVPHRNLRVFVDGNLVHSDEDQLDRKLFDSTMFPERNATTDDLISALCFALSGSYDHQNFSLHDTSVLSQLLAAQRIDTVGIVRARALYENLSPSAQATLLDKTSLARIGFDRILNDSESGSNEAESMLRRYFVAATMKDCSIMISMRVVPKDCAFIPLDVIKLPNGVTFAYSVKIVDLDPKSPKNLVNAHGRFVAGVKMIKLEMEQGSRLHKPCVTSTF